MKRPISNQFARMTQGYIQEVLEAPDWPSRVTPVSRPTTAISVLVFAAIRPWMA